MLQALGARTSFRRVEKQLAALVFLSLSAALLAPSFDVGPTFGARVDERKQRRSLQIDSFCYDNLLKNADFEDDGGSASFWQPHFAQLGTYLEIEEHEGSHVLAAKNRTLHNAGMLQVLGTSTSCLMGENFYIRIRADVRMYDEDTGEGITTCHKATTVHCPLFRFLTHTVGENRHRLIDAHDTNVEWDPDGWNAVDVIVKPDPIHSGDDLVENSGIFLAGGGPVNAVMLFDNLVVQRLEESDLPDGHPVYEPVPLACTENTLVNGDGEYQSSFGWNAFGSWESPVTLDAVESTVEGSEFALVAYDRTQVYQGFGQWVKNPTTCYGGSQYYIHFTAHVKTYDQATGNGITSCDVDWAIKDCPYIAVRLRDFSYPTGEFYDYFDKAMVSSWDPDGWNKLSIVVAFSPGFVETTWDQVHVSFAGAPPGAVIMLDNAVARRIQYEEIPDGHEILDISGNSILTPIKTCRSTGDPHLVSFNGTAFDSHIEGWVVLYQLGDLKVETHQTKLLPGEPRSVAVNKAVKVTYKGKIYEFANGTKPAEDEFYRPYYDGEKLVLTEPPAKVFLKYYDVEHFDYYNVWVSTSETEGAQGYCANVEQALAESAADQVVDFPEDAPTLEEAEAACTLVVGTEEYDDCIFDFRTIASTLDENATAIYLESVKDAAELDTLIFRENRADTYFRLTGEEINDPSIQGDPLIVGLKNQVFKFDGRSDAWYANLATESLQWNMKFHQFPSCPSEGNVFVTGIAIGIRESRRLTHSVVVRVKDEGSFFPGCGKDSSACLADGSLEIMLDGESILSPGDYFSSWSNGGLRVVAYNTFEACSRKWHDIMQVDDDLPKRVKSENKRHLHSQKPPISFLSERKGNSINPTECKEWIKQRTEYDDLFSQPGGWSTIHIETPHASFHVEYRQNLDVKDGTCISHSIDAWMSKVSPKLKSQEWRGILGETRERKLDVNGRQVLSDRKQILIGQKDEDYEVSGPYGINFRALKMYPWHWPLLLGRRSREN